MTYSERFAEAGTAQADLPGQHIERYQEWVISPPRPSLAPSKFDKRGREAMARLGLEKVPEAFRQLYKQHDGLRVNWKIHDSAYGPAVVAGYEWVRSMPNIFTSDVLGTFVVGGLNYHPLWPAGQAPYAEYAVFSTLSNITCIVWRPVGTAVELALYLGPGRLHRLPFNPVEYLEAGLAFHFLDLWQLLFVAEAEQDDYAEAIGTVLGQVRHFFPAALALIPAHVPARFPVPAPLPGPDYRQLVHDTVAALRRVPGLAFHDSSYEAGPGASLGVLERARRELGRPLPAQLRAFYQQLNGFSLTWELPVAVTPAGWVPNGSVMLWSLERVFGGPSPTYQWHWDDTLNNGVLWSAEHYAHTPALHGLYPFDCSDPELYPSLKLPAAPAAEAELYLLGHHKTSELAYLRLSFADYLVTALAGAGLQGWQRYFLADAAAAGVLGDLVNAPPLPAALRQAGLDPAHRLPAA